MSLSHLSYFILFLIGKYIENFINKNRKGCLKANPKDTESIQEEHKDKNKKEEGIEKNSPTLI